jgi:hypothetical protein
MTTLTHSRPYVVRQYTRAFPRDMLGHAHILGTPGSSPAPEATLERGAPRGMHQNS